MANRVWFGFQVIDNYVLDDLDSSTLESPVLSILINKQAKICRVKLKEVKDIVTNHSSAIPRQFNTETIFWNAYKIVADEYDKDLLNMSREELKHSLIFVRI
jgi:hypothetical protein